VLDAIDAHAKWMVDHGELEARRAHRAGTEVEAIAVAALRARIGSVTGGDALDQLVKRVVAGELDPYAAADQLIEHLT
jgi:LAO/AO transport system kinase